MQETFSNYVDEDFRQIVEDFGFSSKLKALKDKCAEILADRIYDAVESALSVARTALIDDLAEIEQDLFDTIDNDTRATGTEN